MKLRMVLGCTALYACVALAAMASGETKQVSYEERVAACNQEAKALKGEQQQQRIGECLKQHGSQQDKMRYCNAEAKRKELHGEERRAFMSSCLKG